MPIWAGSLDSVIGPPIHARLPLTVMQVTSPLKVVSWPAFPVVIVPRAVDGPVSESGRVVGQRILLHGDTEYARAEQHVSTAIDRRDDGIAAMLRHRGSGRPREAASCHDGRQDESRHDPRQSRHLTLPDLVWLDL